MGADSSAGAADGRRRALPRPTGDALLVTAAAAASAGAGVLVHVPSGRVAPFAVSAVALALLAAVIGRSVQEVGTVLGPGATGVLHSILGNLPELFFGIFALRAGLVRALEAALVGSVLGNVLLVLGLAFVVGGLRHGTQRFNAPAARALSLLLVLAVAVVMVPTLAAALHTPVASHEQRLSDIAAIILLAVYALSLVALLGPERRSRQERGTGPGRSAVAPAAGGGQRADATARLARPLVLMVLAGVAAAFVADWFVTAMQPAIAALHISQAFTGLVIVAVAGNLVENAVGVQLAAADRTDEALSVILQSPLQVALVLIPALVLLSHVIAGPVLSLAVPPLLIASLALAAVIGVIVVFDGESTWMEGIALLGLYVVIAGAFWWG